MRPHPPVFDVRMALSLFGPVAAIIAASIAYGMLAGTVERSAQDIAELKAQLRDVGQIDRRVAVLDSNFGTIDKRLERIERALELLAQRAQEFKPNTRVR
jgi:hypothetical protein